MEANMMFNTFNFPLLLIKVVVAVVLVESFTFDLFFVSSFSITTIRNHHSNNNKRNRNTFLSLSSQIITANDCFRCNDSSRTTRRYQQLQKQPSLYINHHRHHKRRLHISIRSLSLHLSYNNQNNDNYNDRYDLSKPIFDLYSLRLVRGDALTKYSTLNQSEPLRINIYLLVCIILLSVTSLYEDLFGIQITLPQIIIFISSSVASFTFFINECNKRNKQLVRIEKELQVLSLYIRLPNTNKFDIDTLYNKPLSIQQALREQPMRIIALYGTKELIQNNLEQLYILRLRLIQANTYVVIVLMDDENNTVTISNESKNKQQYISTIDSLFSQNDQGQKFNNNRQQQKQRQMEFIAEPYIINEWKEYFNSLIISSSSSKSSLYWFGLTPSGRSFASGTQSPTSWLQLFGQYILPMDILDIIDDNNVPNNNEEETTSTSTTETILFRLQNQFYNALTTGDVDTMTNIIFSKEIFDDEVTTIMKQGRLDSWSNCLLNEETRPDGMKISDRDYYQSPTNSSIAYTTAIEFPKQSYNNMNNQVLTLLGVQKWVYVKNNSISNTGVVLDEVSKSKNDEKDDGGIWKLLKHQTIPWTTDIPANGILICDSRGCVSLTATTTTRKR